MKDERILAVREKVLKIFAIAGDKLQSADLLYESEKHRESIPLLRDSVLYAIKSLLMLSADHLPDDSLLVDSYHQTETSKEIKLDLSLNKIIKKLRNAEQDSIEHPLSLSEKSIKDLDACKKQIKDFLAKANRVIKKSLSTTQEIKKRKFARKLIIVTYATIVVIFIAVKAILWLATLGNGLVGNYFADQELERFVKKRKDKEINFEWGNENIIENYFDDVSVRWTGKIRAPRTGEYQFIARSDDGARLWIDDKLIIDVCRQQPPENHRAEINLEKGYNRIKIEYFERVGGATMKLLWMIPGTQKPKAVSRYYLKPWNWLFVDSHQKVSNFPVGEIIKGIEIGQTFYCNNDNLARIEVMLATWARENHQDVIFHSNLYASKVTKAKKVNEN